jgi:hypothetical protein
VEEVAPRCRLVARGVVVVLPVVLVALRPRRHRVAMSAHAVAGGVHPFVVPSFGFPVTPLVLLN